MTTVSSTTGGRFGDFPSVYLHNDDRSALSNVTPYHLILTYIKCLPAQFENRGLNPVPQKTNDKSFTRINVKIKKFVAFSYDVFISHMPL